MTNGDNLKLNDQSNFSIRLPYKIRHTAMGFTLLELITTVAILLIMAGLAIPVFSSWLPDYRLKNAAMELFFNIKMAKTMAIKSNRSYRVIFDTGACGSYRIQDMDGEMTKKVDFSNYDPDGNIGYGCGKAIKSATESGGPVPQDFISYVSNRATFNPRYMGSAGYVYLANSKGTAYAVGTWSTGNVVVKKWNKDTGSWE